jgi:hypothetical protein
VLLAQTHKHLLISVTGCLETDNIFMTVFIQSFDIAVQSLSIHINFLLVFKIYTLVIQVHPDKI